jgi:hypothetical protein
VSLLDRPKLSPTFQNWRAYAAFLAATFFWATFFDASLSAAARLSAHRFFNAATIAALPAALSFRFGFFVGSGARQAF